MICLKTALALEANFTQLDPDPHFWGADPDPGGNSFADPGGSGSKTLLT